MIKTFIKKHYILLFLILAHAITHHVWVFNNDYLTYGDARVYPPQMQADLVENSQHTYATGLDIGSFELSGGVNIIKYIHGILAEMGIYYNYSFRIIYTYPYVFLAPLAIYLLASNFISSRAGLLAAGVLYLFNSYFLVLQSAGMTMLLGNMWGTFMLHFYHRYFSEGRKVSDFSFIILFSFITSVYEFRIFYISMMLCTLYVVYRFLFIERKASDIVIHGVIAGTVLILNSFWFLPVIFAGQLLENRLFSRGLFGNGYFDLYSAFTLYHRFWSGEGVVQFVNQPIPPLMWVVPLVTVAALFVYRGNKYVYFFGIIALLGVFLTKQTDAPFSQVYEWLYYKIPGFNAFREASKFYFITAVGYSVLAGYFFQWLWSRHYTTHLRKLGVAVFTILFVGMFLYEGRALLTMKYGTLFVPRHLPSEYATYNDFITKTPGYYRTLWVPSDSKWAYYSNKNSKLSFGSLSTVYWEHFKKAPEYKAYDVPQNTIANLLLQSFSNNLLDAHNIRYVIVPIQDKANDDDFFIHFGGDREFYLKLTKELKYLNEIDIGTEELAVFENYNYKPRLYTTETPEKLNEYVTYGEIEYTQVSPTEYQIVIESPRGINYINFSERYDPGWRMQVGKLYWLDIILQKNEFLPNDLHTANEYNTNQFELPEELREQEIPVELTLYYHPQAFFELGKAVSLIIGKALILTGLMMVVVNNVRRVHKS